MRVNFTMKYLAGEISVIVTVLGAVILILAVPFLIALGLWLLGVPLDWASWKTYAGLIVMWIAAVIS